MQDGLMFPLKTTVAIIIFFLSFIGYSIYYSGTDRGKFRSEITSIKESSVFFDVSERIELLKRDMAKKEITLFELKSSQKDLLKYQMSGYNAEKSRALLFARESQTEGEASKYRKIADNWEEKFKVISM